MNATIKPSQFGSHPNLAIYNCSPYDVNSQIDNVGWDISALSFYSTERNIPQELYRREHIEIPFSMLYKLARNGLAKEIEWTSSAHTLFLESCTRHEKIVKIKQMDMNIIHSTLDEAGLDPSTFQRSLRDHQLQSLAMYLVCESAANFGQMRTGKTPPTILYAYWCLAKKLVDKVIIVVPNSIKWIWYNELIKDLPVFIHSFTSVIEGLKSAKAHLWQDSAIIKIVNYEGIRADFQVAQKSLENSKFLLILDECHAVKNADAQQTMRVKEIAKMASRLILMSGTPVANKPQDVFEPIQMLAPRLLGLSRDHFIKHHAYTNSYGQVDGWRKDALEKIHNKMATISVRALRKDVNLEIGKQIQPQILDMPKKLQDLYNEVLTALKYEFESAGTKNSLFITSFLARLVRLQQVTDGYLPKLSTSGSIERYIWFDKELEIPNPKMDFIQDWIDNYLEDDKLVIFSRFVPVLERLYSTYRKYGARLIYGATDKHDVSRYVEDFQNRKDCQIMICNTVCSEGKDFNPCNFVVFYDRVFGLKDNLQAEDRVTGMLQVKESLIMPLCLKDTIDTNLETKVLPRKRADANKVQDGIGVNKDVFGLQDITDLLGV